MGEVRESATVDHERLAGSLAEAFADDPVAEWCVPKARLRAKMLRRFFGEYLRQKQRYDTVWCDGELSGAAVWAPPGKGILSGRDSLALGMRLFEPRVMPRAPMILWGAAAVERKHPKEPPSMYLAALGVSPHAQGQGLGSRLLAPALEICDRDGVGAYLESSKQSNIAFYARHGFRVTEEHRMPRGPMVYLMWREPAGVQAA